MYLYFLTSKYPCKIFGQEIRIAFEVESLNYMPQTNRKINYSLTRIIFDSFLIFWDFWYGHSAFFTVQLSHPYMTTRKTIASARRTFVGKVMSLLFNLLFRLVITLFPRSKHLLISWLQSPSAVILEPPKIKSEHN